MEPSSSSQEIFTETVRNKKQLRRGSWCLLKIIALGALLMMYLQLNLIMLTGATRWKFKACYMDSSGETECGLINDLGLGSNLTMTKGWATYKILSVDWYGAAGNGVTDDTQAFKNAWSDACALDSAIVIVPRGKTYLVNAVEFNGPCGDITLYIAGTVVAPTNIQLWQLTSSLTWLFFNGLNKLSVIGGGIVNGQGQEWWAQSCKKNPNNQCTKAPTSMQFYQISNLFVKNIKSLNSPQIHINFYKTHNVHVSDVHVFAPADSPNTDGIHIASSTNVQMENLFVQTGDDCISIVNGSFDVKMRNINCGPGHGISIGSLGANGKLDNVSSIVVDGATFIGSSNGIRVKSWKNGNGAAMGMLFQNIQMNNVGNPIIIDQNYCDTATAKCPTTETSAVDIGYITYRNISGTSASNNAITLGCSGLTTCRGLQFENINLVSASGGDTETNCRNAQGSIQGNIFPSLVGCLQLTQGDPNVKAKSPSSIRGKH